MLPVAKHSGELANISFLTKVQRSCLMYFMEASILRVQTEQKGGSKKLASI